jgi:tRNA(fMet)-specific endonuclease VapC
VTASELLHGVHRATTAEQRTKREAYVESILATMPLLPFDLLVARVHAQLDADLAAKGGHLGAHDLQIAATALAYGESLATRDEKSFPKVPGLTVERW